jgi:hypothetical protein
MSTRLRECKTPEIEHVRKFVAYAKLRVNSMRYYPPLNVYRFTVALALYSKCLTVAEATMALLDAGFSDEAFGMTRTLVDIYITLRYIANQDTEERARLYYKFVAKNIHGWSEIVQDYWPHSRDLWTRASSRLRPSILTRIGGQGRAPRIWLWSRIRLKRTRRPESPPSTTFHIVSSIVGRRTSFTQRLLR